MNNKKEIILIVDDEALVRDAHSLLLQALGYHVLHAEDGVEAQKILADNVDEVCVVVTDILMPKMDGYELCEKIRADDRFKDLPVLFVTALDTLDEKIKGYAAGGNDYIVKPLIADELNSKIQALLEIRKNNLDLKQRLQESSQAAMQAMSYSSDLGKILEFYRNSLSAPDFKTIASLLFDVTNAYGLKCLLQIYTVDQTVTFIHAGKPSPLEVNIMELARNKSRFLDFGARTLINYKDFSLLLKNMPTEDPERYGTLKDSLGNLCEAIASRVSIILSDDTRTRKQQVLATIRDALNEISADFKKVQKENITAIEDMMSEVDQTFLSLGLSEQQEGNIHAITKQCLDKTNENYYKGIAVNDRFEEIHRRLETILG